MMRSILLALATTLSTSAFGMELLTNPNLDAPGVHEGVIATGWTLVDGPVIPPSPPLDPGFDPVAANFPTFANHNSGGTVGLWFRPFEGAAEDSSNAVDENQVFAHLTQSVAGTPGLKYTMTAWANFEKFYAGGVTNLNAAQTEAIINSTDGLPSPTKTFLALEFLNSSSTVLPGSIVLDLIAAGQVNNAGWKQHTLMAVAPAGTVSVRVRGSMIDGVANPSANPQSAFLDEFSLTAVPEPSTVALGALALAGLFVAKRRR